MSPQTPSPWWLGRRIARYRAGRFLAGLALWTAFFSIPAAVGLVLRWVFDAIAGAGPVGWNLPTLLVLLMAVEGTRLAVLYGGVRVFVTWWVQLETLLRTNLLAAQLANDVTAQGPPVPSASGAIPVFRDDAEDLLNFGLRGGRRGGRAPPPRWRSCRAGGDPAGAPAPRTGRGVAHVRDAARSRGPAGGGAPPASGPPTAGSAAWT